MAKDHLLPRSFLRTDPLLDTHRNIHTMFLAGIALFAISTGANLEVLGHWYGGTFGAVMLSGVIGIILLRHFQPNVPRPYRAPWDFTVMGTRVPLAAFVGAIVVGGGAGITLHVRAGRRSEPSEAPRLAPGARSGGDCLLRPSGVDQGVGAV